MNAPPAADMTAADMVDLAARQNNVEVLRFLLDDCRAPIVGYRAITIAISRRANEATEFLLERDVPVDADVAFSATFDDNLHAVRLIFDRYPDMDYSESVRVALQTANLDVLQFFLDKGLQISDDSITDMILTGHQFVKGENAYEKHCNMIEFLISRGLPLHESATMAAIRTGSAGVLRILLKNRAPVCALSVQQVCNGSMLACIKEHFMDVLKCEKYVLEEYTRAQARSALESVAHVLTKHGLHV
jgi:hypothetical protein